MNDVGFFAPVTIPIWLFSVLVIMAFVGLMLFLESHID